MKWKVIIDKLNKSNCVRIVPEQEKLSRQHTMEASANRFATIDEAVEYARVLTQVSGIRHIRINHNA
ncbi:MAG: hypothetical protein MUE95_02625 [Cyclobacteriaceae bacterium]|nr:hypothetical protein [Cyclobacteriaceae bacterium]